MKPDVFLMRAATEASRLTRLHDQEYYLVAVAVRSDGAIVSSSNKSSRSITPKGKVPSRILTSHAEFRVCRKIDRGAVVFVARVTKNGVWANARPCNGCLLAMKQKRVSEVYFTIGPKEYGVISVIS